jgi:hypothetical protein
MKQINRLKVVLFEQDRHMDAIGDLKLGDYQDHTNEIANDSEGGSDE